MPRCTRLAGRACRTAWCSSTSTIRGASANAFLGEATHTFGRANAIYGRLETLQVEDELLLFGVHGFTGGGRKRHVPDTGEGRNYLTAVTMGAARTLARPWGLDLGIGADITGYVVPTILQPIYGSSPISFHVFFRIRPPAPMGRMLDMTMGGKSHVSF